MGASSVAYNFALLEHRRHVRQKSNMQTASCLSACMAGVRQILVFSLLAKTKKYNTPSHLQ
jgi:hypothetical protein